VSESTERLRAAIVALYDRFSAHTLPPALPFCDFCWSPAEIERLRAAPLRSLDVDLAQKLVWEASDHWPSVEVYKHFLPRMLEAMSPCAGLDVEDLYPAHLFEVLAAQRFHTWPGDERRAVLEWVEAMRPMLGAGGDGDEWDAAAAAFRNS
jgi:hypothetical protein